MANSEIITKLHDRFAQDAAGFCKAFTKVFNEQDGTPQALYPKQVEFMNLLRPNENVIVVNKCRQSGFSTGIQGKALHRAYFGKVPEILITSAGQNQSIRVLKKIKSFFASMPEFMQVEFRVDKETQIQLANGTIIYSLPANPDTCRGFTGDVFMDEYGVASRKEGDELWSALYPCITKGYTIVAVSTPKGKNNMFYDLTNNYKIKVDPETGVIKTPQPKRLIEVPWWDVPHVKAQADDLRLGMHEKQWQQEYECMFLDDADTEFFSLDFMLDHVVDQRDNAVRLIPHDAIFSYEEESLPSDCRAPIEPGKYPGGIYCGWDVAVVGDGSIVTIFGITSDGVWEMIGYKKFEKGTDLSDQVPVVSKLVQYYGAKRITVDATGMGLAAFDLLRKTKAGSKVREFKFNPATKMQEYTQLRAKMAQEGFRIPEIKECINEFANLGYNPTTGRIRAQGSSKNHDDWPSSFLCAYAGRKKGIVQPGFTVL